MTSRASGVRVGLGCRRRPACKLLRTSAGPLQEGDAVRLTASGGQRVTATTPAEILVWEMHTDLFGS